MNSKLTVVSLHWGFSLGGIGKYATLIDEVRHYGPVEIANVCVVGRDWQCDRPTLSRLRATVIEITSRLDLTWITRVAREIDVLRPDLLMTHGFNGHFVALVTRPWRKHFAMPVCSYHGEYYPTNNIRGLLIRQYNRMTEYYLRHHARGIVAVAEFSKRYLVAHGVDPGKIRVIHNGINELKPSRESRSTLRAEWNVLPDDLLIGVASRLDPVKGVSYLVDALALLAPRFPNLKLVIIGTGTRETELKKQVRERGLVAQCIFTGFRSDIDNCLAAFDIFVLPSLAEYHSIALLEAMRAGKTIVATDVGGNSESVRHEKEALLVPPADASALAGTIDRLVMDPALRDKLGAVARERFLKEFTVENMVRQTAEWLMQCGMIARQLKTEK